MSEQVKNKKQLKQLKLRKMEIEDEIATLECDLDELQCELDDINDLLDDNDDKD